MIFNIQHICRQESNKSEKKKIVIPRERYVISSACNLAIIINSSCTLKW